MSGYATSVKDYVERYKAEVGSDGLLDPHAVAEWAYSQGLHKPSLRTVIDAIATDIAQVFREEYRVDGAGRRDRKSTRLTPVTNAHLVCRLLLEKNKHAKPYQQRINTV